jgi:hypothetical protein
MKRDPAAFTPLNVACRYISRPPSVPIKLPDLSRARSKLAGLSRFYLLFGEAVSTLRGRRVLKYQPGKNQGSSDVDMICGSMTVFVIVRLTFSV